MGAHSFTDTTERSDPAEGFRELHDQATLTYGHDGYNGTISTVAGFSRSTLYQNPVPSNCLGVLEDRVWAEESEGRVPEIRKWESCLAVPLADPKYFEWEKRSFVFEIESRGSRTLSLWDAKGRVMKELEQGEWAADIEIEKLTPDREMQISEVETDPGEPIGFTVAAVTENGPALGGVGREKIYETREEAVAGALAEARHAARFDGGDFTVVELRGAGLTCGQARARDQYRVTYKLARAKKNQQISGWAFIGLAAS